ncbi:hypothetical protein [Actinomadura harenae]|uniref:Uncharacterized protein n=1 Tax=Actinomadura harenae TaxID=2483351 RepID=A0A3M2M9X2_9ACTN|nr:hypothetical protein [Actinomadura harenae]RMI46584.1 hypothetical protein EBO15_06565 [Actinomadura harenae]
MEVLGGFLRHDLPPLRWQVEADGSLLGESEDCKHERQLRAFLEPWAEFLEAPLVVERSFAHVRAKVEVRWDGIEIECGKWAPRRWLGVGGRPVEEAPPLTGEGAAAIRRRQLQAVRTLGTFLAEDLPALDWWLPYHGSRRVLQGEPDTGTEAAVRETFDRWGRFLGADVVEERDSGSAFFTINVKGGAFDVRVWEHLVLDA